MRVRAVLVFLLAVGGCSKKETPSAADAPQDSLTKGECDGVDGTNLEVVVRCFYGAKNSSSLRRLYSKAALQEESAEETATSDSSSYDYTDVRIAKKETVNRQTFAAVSRTHRKRLSDGGLGCADTGTRTWVWEEAKWRLHGGTIKLAEATRRKNYSGDYSGAVQAADEWLKVDPLDVEAYKEIAFAVRAGARGRSADDVIRAVMGIDPKSSTAISVAVSLAPTPDVQEAFLDRLSPDDCSIGEAISAVAFGYLADSRPAEVLRVLDRYPAQPDGPDAGRRTRDAVPLYLLRVKALQALRRQADAVAFLTPSVISDIRVELEARDPTSAGSIAALLASVNLDVGRKDEARLWIDFGLTRDPSNRELSQLLRRLKK